MKKPKVFDIRTYPENKVIQVVEGQTYSAIGTCGMTKDKEVVGVLEKIDSWGACLICDGIPHSCNERTLKPV